MANPETTYEQWMRDEGLPVYRGHGVTDLRALDLGPWPRLGGRGAYLQLEGMEGLTGMYVGEIPAGAALTPEKHLYDELVYVLAGRGITQVWNESGPLPADAAPASFFEWQAGSLFAPPLNCWHRLLNSAGGEPVRFLAVTSAPLVLDLFHNVDFVFNSDYRFADRYAGEADYFAVRERRFDEAGGVHIGGWLWETNFIPDVPATPIDPRDAKGAGVRGTSYQMSGNVLVGHLGEWPVGRYHKAHHHAGGAIILIVRSRGYTLMWPQALGIHPYASGYGDEVVRVDWQEGSVLSPPSGWFHQHFNLGPVPARLVALRYGSRKYGVQFHDAQSRAGVHRSVKQGGTLIEYEDEDPAIRAQFQRDLAAAGVPYGMPAALGASASNRGQGSAGC
jgi:hypothetical protein